MNRYEDIRDGEAHREARREEDLDRLPVRRGGLEKIPDQPNEEICSHPEHNPPMHLCIPAGMRYRHVCPGCGHEILVVSSNPRFMEGVMPIAGGVIKLKGEVPPFCKCKISEDTSKCQIPPLFRVGKVLHEQ